MAKFEVAICVEVYAVDGAYVGYSLGVEEVAAEVCGGLAIGVGEADASLCSVAKPEGHVSQGNTNRRRADDENRRYRHTRFDGGFADFSYERGDPERSRPGIAEWVRELKVVGAEHEDDERERRVALDALGESAGAVTAGLEGIVPDGAAAVKAVFDHADVLAVVIQGAFDDAGPALVELETLACAGNEPPAKGIRVNKNRVHWDSAWSGIEKQEPSMESIAAQARYIAGIDWRWRRFRAYTGGMARSE
jgi:hypothetical protein